MARALSYQVGILTLGHFLSYAVRICVPLVIVRALTVEEFGVYQQFLLLFNTISPVLVMAFPFSLLYYFPRAEDKSEKSLYVTQTIAFLLGTAILAWGIYAVLFHNLGGDLGAIVQRFFWRISIFTGCTMIASYMDQLFAAEKQAGRQSLYLAVTASSMAAVVMLVSWYTRNVDDVIWALMIFAIGKCIFALSYTGRAYRTSVTSISARTVKEQLSYAFPLGMAVIALVLLTQTDKFVITHFMGREAFAIYSIGAIQIPFAFMIRGSITSVTFPLMAQHQKEGEYAEILNIWHRAALKTAVLFFPIFVFLEATARPFITILFTEKYADAAPVFAIYLLFFLRSTIDTGSILKVFNRTGFLFAVNLIGFVMNVVLSISFYKAFGRLGVPAATVVVIYLGNLANLIVSGRLMSIPLTRLLPWGRLLKRLAAAVIPGVILWPLYRVYSIENVFELAGAAAIYSAIYLLIVLRLRYVTAADIRAVFRRESG